MTSEGIDIAAHAGPGLRWEPVATLPGSAYARRFRVVDVAGGSVIVLRDERGTLRAFRGEHEA